MTKLGEARSLVWQHGVVSVESLGGMLGPTLFVLPDGRQVAPFQIAPWADEPGGEDVPAILRRLRGEWPCVPFGADADRPAEGNWPGSTAAGAVDPLPHGFSSNNDWQFEAADGGSIALMIAYPSDHPIRGLTRRVTPDPAAAALDFELAIDVRADCVLPIGLHPSFRLPPRPGAMRIEVAPTTAGMTFPGPVDASSIFQQGVMLKPWHDVPLEDGGRLDVSRVPLASATEELVQLLDMPGLASLWNSAEGYRVRLSWNRDHYPSALLWFSNRGRRFAPWNGRHLALGLEPICSAFDLGPQISAADNPISRRGTPTVRQFRAGEQFVTRYRIAVEPAEIL
ncbi:MAG: hypothetical protein JWQ89_2543 [Devosia sp.]|uniref:hypothetical protein n=1 Tax=Devosia sp. TaxID=1871048 RepID=UPI0026235C3F|nr:hypothetical protein [Devosia sp.]MDB5540816.1 hypothetical protein [Devosia sp.]